MTDQNSKPASYAYDDADRLTSVTDYMHANPFTRKLVDHPKDWPWSSWSFYAKGGAGLVPIDPVG